MLRPQWYGGDLSTIVKTASPSITFSETPSIGNQLLSSFRHIFADGDVIATGIKKTYHKIADLIGLSAEDIAGWGTRTIEISNAATEAARSHLSGNGLQAAEDSKLDLEVNGAYLATYGVDSTRGEIQLSGSASMTNGEAKIFFDKSFSEIISRDAPIRVLITPTIGINGQLYVAYKSEFGFIVREMNALDQTVTFDWLVIARRVGFDGASGATSSPDSEPTVTPTAEPTISLSDPEPTLPTISPEADVGTPTESVGAEPMPDVNIALPEILPDTTINPESSDPSPVPNATE
jgi:hypothetical protein